MKTLYALVLLAFIGLAILGCTDLSDQLVTPVDKASILNGAGSLDKGDGILHSATGSAHWRAVPITGETYVKYSFSAIQHKDGNTTGELILRDHGPIYVGKANVYDLDVDDNMVKLAFHFTKGNLGGFYSPSADINDIYGWLIAIDNGEGNTATGPDLVSMILFTDGSDIGYETIEGIDNMEPQVFLDWMHDYLLPLYGVPYEAYLTPIDNGSIQVR